MRSTHDDGIVIRETGVLRVSVECLCSVVHRRPQEVAFQTQKKLEHLPIGLRSDLSAFLVKVALSPE